jgi:hypothetical protein
MDKTAEAIFLLRTVGNDIDSKLMVKVLKNLMTKELNTVCWKLKIYKKFLKVKLQLSPEILFQSRAKAAMILQK